MKGTEPFIYWIWMETHGQSSSPFAGRLFLINLL